MEAEIGVDNMAHIRAFFSMEDTERIIAQDAGTGDEVSLDQFMKILRECDLGPEALTLAGFHGVDQ